MGSKSDDSMRGSPAARESPQTIVNAAFGGPPGHPFWQAVVEELPSKYWPLRDKGNINMVETTGPHHLTGMCDTHPDEVRIAPKNIGAGIRCVKEGLTIERERRGDH